MTVKQPRIAQLTWEQARKYIPDACKEIRDIIDNIDPNKDYTFIKAHYPFGTEILRNVVFYLPTENNLCPITDTKIPKNIQEQLSYSPMPLGIIIKNNIEVYREMENSVFSLACYGNGLDIGIWEHFGWTTPYSISSGARSLYLLPKISSSLSHKKLKKEFEITAPIPKNYCNQWHLFKNLANSPQFPEKWHCEILFLTKNVVTALKTDPAWRELNAYLLRKGWQHSDYGRRNSILDVVWSIFAESLNKKGIKTAPYVINTLKHLTALSTGILPASRPFSGQSNANGPIAILQHIFESYEALKKYVPTFMEPAYFSTETNNAPVYYSMQYPTLLTSIPKIRNMTSIIENMRELKELSDYFFAEAFDENLQIKNVSIKKLIDQIHFEYFHGKMYAYGQYFRPSEEMPKQDATLLYTAGNLKGREFPNYSPYLHGCIRIVKK